MSATNNKTNNQKSPINSDRATSSILHRYSSWEMGSTWVPSKLITDLDCNFSKSEILDYLMVDYIRISSLIVCQILPPIFLKIMNKIANLARILCIRNSLYPFSIPSPTCRIPLRIACMVQTLTIIQVASLTYFAK